MLARQLKVSESYSDVTPRSPDSLCLLVADDVEDNRLLLKAILERAGHRVLLAENGAEAVSIYDAEQPDMILMDVMMPVMDGYEAARIIKLRAAQRFVPIIFVTALTDDRQLAKCVEAGGDDFLVKPIRQILIKAKLFAMQRLRNLYQESARQQRELQVHHDRLRHEHEVAEHVFARIVGNTAFQVANIQYELSPMAIVNGDLILTMMTPDGNQLVMLGDFAGHGLSAAIGAIPAFTIFRAMAEKGFGIDEIVAELNRKLHVNLPTGHFLAACLLEWNPRAATMRIWNGGVPDVLIVAEHGGIVSRVSSNNLPLGVVGDREFSAMIEAHGVSAGDRLIAYSDGLIEARNDEGDMFGQERLEHVIDGNRDRGRLFDEIRGAVRSFRGGAPQNDDVTLVEIQCDPRLLEGVDGEQATMKTSSTQAAHWKMAVNLGPGDFADFDPLAVAGALVNCVPLLAAHQSSLCMVIVELYVNALDHGVLKLDSALKRDADGFSHYYAERERRLAELSGGWIRIDLECWTDGAAGGEVRLGIADSGDGFDLAAVPPADEAGKDARGRGIGLVRRLCKSLEYNRRGNAVKAVYGWSAPNL